MKFRKDTVFEINMYKFDFYILEQYEIGIKKTNIYSNMQNNETGIIVSLLKVCLLLRKVREFVSNNAYIPVLEVTLMESS
jgi:hypothetical protein